MSPQPSRKSIGAWASDVATVMMAAAAVVVAALAARTQFDDRAPASTDVVIDVERLAKPGHGVGPRDAKLLIVEFSDFECPSCARAATALTEFQRRHPDDVRIVYRHLPLSDIHPHAEAAAEAAACADRQGRFEAFHDTLFQRQDSIGVSAWSRLAFLAGVPRIQEFDTCVKRRETRDLVSYDRRTARALGIEATPTLLVHGRVFAGVPTLEQMQTWLREAD